jgi:hypothetical protein
MRLRLLDFNRSAQVKIELQQDEVDRQQREAARRQEEMRVAADDIIARLHDVRSSTLVPPLLEALSAVDAAVLVHRSLCILHPHVAELYTEVHARAASLAEAAIRAALADADSSPNRAGVDAASIAALEAAAAVGESVPPVPVIDSLREAVANVRRVLATGQVAIDATARLQRALASRTVSSFVDALATVDGDIAAHPLLRSGHPLVAALREQAHECAAAIAEDAIRAELAPGNNCFHYVGASVEAPSHANLEAAALAGESVPMPMVESLRTTVANARRVAACWSLRLRQADHTQWTCEELVVAFTAIAHMEGLALDAVDAVVARVLKNNLDGSTLIDVETAMASCVLDQAHRFPVTQILKLLCSPFVGRKVIADLQSANSSSSIPLLLKALADADSALALLPSLGAVHPQIANSRSETHAHAAKLAENDIKAALVCRNRADIDTVSIKALEAAPPGGWRIFANANR